MLITTLILTGVAALSATLLGSAAQGATLNLIANGDFEAGNAGFTTSLAYNPSIGVLAEVYDVENSRQAWTSNFLDYGDHTSGTGNMMMVNGSFVNGSTTWSQPVTVAANTDYVFSG